jgi:trehalose/maltose hydrolase-like predicted phosphorylase
VSDVLEPTPDPEWVLHHKGYNVLTENEVESRFAFGNGFLGMRAARSVARGATWTSWLRFIRWASWPRCYVAGLFDIPNTEPPVPALVPVADWSRVQIVLDGIPVMEREGQVLSGVRTLDMRRGWLPRPGRTARPPASPSLAAKSGFCRSRTAPSDCNFGAPRSITAASKCARRPVSRWPGSG